MQDQGKPPRAATASVQVQVTDSDDLSPKFTKDVYRTQIMEFYPISVSSSLKEILCIWLEFVNSVKEISWCKIMS